MHGEKEEDKFHQHSPIAHDPPSLKHFSINKMDPLPTNEAHKTVIADEDDETSETDTSIGDFLDDFTL